MYEKMRAYILPQLIPPNAKVLLAVSGGPDSMALSHILRRYVREERSRGNSLVLTHVHHGVRKESDDEVLLVQNMAAKWEIPCIVHRFDAMSYAKTMGQSFEEAAREWRYARWKEDMRKEGCALLATGHHLGDQAETILYRLFRGSGAAGLAGIYPIRDSIIRPLLTFLKAEILNYCAQEALPYALDRSNEEPVYVRNRIRLELIPELEMNYNPRIQEALGRTGELLRWDEDYLSQKVEEAGKHYLLMDPRGTVGLSLDVFTEPPAILSRLLRRIAKQVTNEPRGLAFGYVTKIMDSRGKLGWMQDLPGMTVNITDEGIWFRSCVPAPGRSSDRMNQLDQTILYPNFTEVVMGVGQWSEIPSLNVTIGLVEERNISTENGTLEIQGNMVAVFNRLLLDRFPEQLVCRTRRQGDRMWFQGVGHKSLKKVFQEEGILADARERLPLIACGTEVLWIPGIRQSGLCRADSNAERVYCILKSQALGSNLDSL